MTQSGQTRTDRNEKTEGTRMRGVGDDGKTVAAGSGVGGTKESPQATHHHPVSRKLDIPGRRGTWEVGKTG